MKITLQCTAICLFLMLSSSLRAQTPQEQALAKGREAIKLEDEGKFEEARKLLEAAEKLDPADISWPYEIALSYNMAKDYKNAIKTLEKLLKRPDVTPLVYQMLGNSYDDSGKSDKAITVYDDGIKKFPNSGILYTERGTALLRKSEAEKALAFYEKGIEMAPEFASNYYWASRILCHSSEPVWGLLYGEIFINLEPGSNRTKETSKLLFDTYVKNIQFKGSSISVTFSKATNINIAMDKPEDLLNYKFPFAMMAYEPLMSLSAVGEKSIDLESLNRIRTKFVEHYFQKDNAQKYPNILFDFQNAMLKAGQLEAYNHWLLKEGAEAGFIAWRKGNQEKMNAFFDWFNNSKNQLVVDRDHHFHRKQYD
jgi:hypothetical protein